MKIKMIDIIEILNKSGELASSRWRSRFGRPTKIDSLGDVSYGVYCKMPEDWLQKKIGMDALSGYGVHLSYIWQ